MGTLETVLILGAVAVGGYFVLTSGVLTNLMQGVGAGAVAPPTFTTEPIGTETELTDEEWEGYEGAMIRRKSADCCECAEFPDGVIACKIKGSTTYTDNEDGDLEGALRTCKARCAFDKGRRPSHERATMRCGCCTCLGNKQGGVAAGSCKPTGQPSYRYGYTRSLSNACNECEDTKCAGLKDAPRRKDIKDWKPPVQCLQRAAKTCGSQPSMTCKCGSKSWDYCGDCNKCKNACTAGKASFGSTFGYGLADEAIKFSMLGRQAARAFVAVPESMDYAYSPNNYDPFQLETGSMRISGV